tara:strand:+ start:10819 stop:10998 length:180 start_codon:yes stop_codon:yes gene_type:complete
MQLRVAQYLNEIVSLSFMGLLIIALVAGQANSTARAAAKPQAEPITETTLDFRQQGELH